MALELLITYKNRSRPNLFHPFSLQDVLRRAWWPLARRLGLPILQQLECLEIRDLANAKALLREFEIVRQALAQPEAVFVSQNDADYMLKRISEVEPSIQTAIEEWEQVDSISL